MPHPVVDASALVLGAVLILAASQAGAVEKGGSPSSRACAAHGPGFTYLPETGTCLRVSGRVRAEAGAGSGKGSGRDERFDVRSNGRLDLDARTDTAAGPLRSFVRVGAGRR